MALNWTGYFSFTETTEMVWFKVMRSSRSGTSGVPKTMGQSPNRQNPNIFFNLVIQSSHLCFIFFSSSWSELLDACPENLPARTALSLLQKQGALRLTSLILCSTFFTRSKTELALHVTAFHAVLIVCTVHVSAQAYMHRMCVRK